MINSKSKKQLSFIIPTILLAASSAKASIFAKNDWDVTSYVGMDAQVRFMELKKDFGGNLAAKTYPQGNVFVGIRFCDYWGVEAGYESTTNRNRKATLLGKDSFFGKTADPNPNFPNDINKYATKTKIDGPHISLAGFYPISEDYSMDLIGSIGVANLKIKITNEQSVGRSDELDLQDASSTRRIFGKRKWVPKANLGIQKMINNQFGVRAMIGWENTSRFGDIKVQNVPSPLVAKTKDSYSIGIGFFFIFK